jgi:phospholipid-binding lipoprotein MlaA
MDMIKVIKINILCISWVTFGLANAQDTWAEEPMTLWLAQYDTTTGGEVTDIEEDPFAEEAEALEISDPLQGFNRAVFWFNDKLYFYLLKPVARGYRGVPEPARVSVNNFFSNMATPIRFVNCILQAKGEAAMTEFARFVINSTVGILGLFDPAEKHAGLKKQQEDFGQTLGHYGVGPGFFLVLPVLGPSNVRDGIGWFADTFVDPWGTIVWDGDKPIEFFAVKGFDIVNTLSLDKDTYERIKEEQLDPYLFIRGAFMQRRAALVKE